LFLQLVRRKTAWQMRFVTAAGSYVPTYPPTSFQQFVKQRIRHFSAGKYFSPEMKLFFFVFHAANLIILLTLLFAIVSGSSFLNFLPYLIKCIFDSMLFLTASPILHETRFGFQVLFMEVLVVLYNSFIGPLGFIKKFEWKPEARS
jgi:hypothetical protein